MARVLVVGSGAREHSIALAHLRDENEVIVTPGNKGMMHFRINGEHSPISIDQLSSLKDPASILAAAQRQKPDYIEVAQDDALAAGTVDLLEENGFRGKVMGPTRDAAQIEWDKEWSREFMKRHGIPHPEYGVFNDRAKGLDFARQLLKRSKTGRVFLKATGLCAGKGATDATLETLEKAVDYIAIFGEAGRRFLVEEDALGMNGEEFSYYAMTDGKNIFYFKSAQDNKRLLNGDNGPNTGGMGAHSPALITGGLETIIQHSIMEPAIRGLAKEGRPYKGILYLGGVVGDDGVPKVIEFNSRWGDPEAQVTLPALDVRGDSYFQLVKLAIEGRLDENHAWFNSNTYVNIVGASVGYPSNPVKGKRIWVEEDDLLEGVQLLSAGVDVRGGELYTNGGRVINVVASGRDISEARAKALAGIGLVYFEGNSLHYRTDIGYRDVERSLAED